MTYLKNNWPIIVALFIALCLAAWAVGCEPKTGSLLEPTRSVTRAELQAELEHLQSKFAIRSAQLAQQEKFRKLILENALLIAETQTLNPLGLITGLAALYGIGSAVRDGKKIVTKKKSTAV